MGRNSIHVKLNLQNKKEGSEYFLKPLYLRKSYKTILEKKANNHKIVW